MDCFLWVNYGTNIPQALEPFAPDFSWNKYLKRHSEKQMWSHVILQLVWTAYFKFLPFTVLAVHWSFTLPMCETTKAEKWSLSWRKNEECIGNPTPRMQHAFLETLFKTSLNYEKTFSCIHLQGYIFLQPVNSSVNEHSPATKHMHVNMPTYT